MPAGLLTFRGPALANLGRALLASYEGTGSLPDLHDAVRVTRAAEAATVDAHLDRVAILSQLGVVLRTRYERAGAMADLDESIEHAREAADGTLPGDFNHGGRLSNLGIALRLRYERTGREQDLDEAVAACREAVSVFRPPARRGGARPRHPAERQQAPLRRPAPYQRRPAMVPLPQLTLEVAARQAAAFLAALEQLAEPGDAHEAALSTGLTWLWDTVASPVLDVLGLTGPPAAGAGWPRVWWIPTGPLAFLPLHAAGHHGAVREVRDTCPDMPSLWAAHVHVGA